MIKYHAWIVEHETRLTLSKWVVCMEKVWPIMDESAMAGNKEIEKWKNIEKKKKMKHEWITNAKWMQYIRPYGICT